MILPYFHATHALRFMVQIYDGQKSAMVYHLLLYLGTTILGYNGTASTTRFYVNEDMHSQKYYGDVIPLRPNRNGNAGRQYLSI